MWDNNAPLQLLKTMPKKLNQENLEKLQLLIDADKYKNSIISGFDLCGIFAPFCRGCDRTSIYPCAVSYIRMLQAQGMKIEIDASPSNYFEPQSFVAPIEIPRTQPQPQPQPVKPVERKPLRKTYEPKYTESKITETKIKEKVVEQKAPQKSFIAEPEVTEEKKDLELAVTNYDSAAEIIASIPELEELSVEEETVVPEETEAVINKEPVEQANVETVTEVKKEEQNKETPATSEEPVKRKFRIAVARRKL